MCHITLNKITIYGENGTIPPRLQIDTPAVTSRDCLEYDFETVADFLLRAAHITTIVLREHGKSHLKVFLNSKDIWSSEAKLKPLRLSL
ncbi:hypothetical protein SLEP1_g31192 [Rubroshorea leprosula]|uniref:Uncharacterized protein n=1 Tax=Rubroshorea leprosula TaxID=152421 RepID=A0AAV5KA37_9ROSI|nr:hypothetical protein SLEP1_g31192 [Rubroshorea leprosula]